ncbi:histidine kinase [Nocardioides sp.]|uniref:sensor histidine kinase n=1 Tax=Nocardioides sp. TaxID=35761 RepID=UPI0027364A56|nr:histidine kinase [Nocardioides sp.]MDP3891546.1 histidine kinase [Nocardioides sp.]
MPATSRQQPTTAPQWSSPSANGGMMGGVEAARMLESWDVAVESVDLRPVDWPGLRQRLHLTAFALVNAALGIPALLLLILTLLSIPLAPLGLGLLLANLVVPATGWLTSVHRRLTGLVLRDDLSAAYADTSGRGLFGRPLVWFRDPGRWRDIAFLAFSATGGFVMSAVVVGLIVNPLVNVLGALFSPERVWYVLAFVLGPLLLTAWWAATPGLVIARAFAERGILNRSREEELERRVEEVTASRSESLDHSAAELRRIERDLHDGPQARIVSLGMNLGLAERLLVEDPVAAESLLREARHSAVNALEELRALVRGIHPPVLAERGLAGAVQALAVAVGTPTVVTSSLDGRPPAPVETAAYFAIAECLANTTKHSGAHRGWVSLDHAAGVLRVVVGDDGRGGADPNGSGLSGVRRRLAAFDGVMVVQSPTGGPTIVTLEVPCELSSPRTTPSSGTD